jgi:hypothetical protein
MREFTPAEIGISIIAVIVIVFIAAAFLLGCTHTTEASARAKTMLELLGKL